MFDRTVCQVLSKKNLMHVLYTLNVAATTVAEPEPQGVASYFLMEQELCPELHIIVF
jgi:hypothetical protein